MGVIISNGPMIFPLFKRWFYVGTSIVSSYRKSSKAATYPLDTVPKNNHDEQKRVCYDLKINSRKNRGFQHPLSIPNDTAWGSDEAIITVNKDGSSTTIMDKSSEASVDMGDEQTATSFTGRQELNSDKRHGRDRGLGDIVMTREWDLSETHEQDQPDLKKRSWVTKNRMGGAVERPPIVA